MNIHENPLNNKIDPVDKLEPIKQVEKKEKIPIKVNDKRSESDKSFDLDKFLDVIERLRTEGLFKLVKEFQHSDYGKFMSVFASTESDNWDEAIQNALALEITLTTPPNKGLESRTKMTDVEIKILMGNKDGRIFNFHFKEGKYHQGAYTNVHLQKRLGDSGTDQDFSLIVEPK